MTFRTVVLVLGGLVEFGPVWVVLERVGRFDGFWGVLGGLVRFGRFGTVW